MVIKMRREIDERAILEQQLIRAKKELFRVNNLRELRVMQHRIQYLTQRLKELEGKATRTKA